MTVPLPCPPPANEVSTAAGPRKRRRRAPASGATDDCFACHKRNVKCDRRRPYCSPCLEIGSECSGYKTQLTWGVGVASRGKLRGLSLPVAKSAPAAKCDPTSDSRPRSSSTIIRHSFDARNGALEEDAVDVKSEGEMPHMTTHYTTYDFINMNPRSPGSINSAAPTSDWNMSQEHIQIVGTPPPSEPVSHQQLLRKSLHRLQPPMMRYGDDLNMSSTASLSGYSDGDYSPMAQSFNGDDVAYMASPMPIYGSYSHDSPVDHSSLYGMSADHRGPTSCPDHFYPQSDVSSSMSSHPTIFELNENRRLADSPAGCNMSDIDFDDDILGMSNSHGSDHFSSTSQFGKKSWISADDDYSHSANNMPQRIPEGLNVGLFPGISPRLSFYLNYYEKIICPVTVAIDSPSNPYRQNILSLAAESQSLQHAICALASCNLRMKRKQSLGQQQSWTPSVEMERFELNIQSHSRNPSDVSNSTEIPLDDASIQEEHHHRGQAVSLLNSQLSSPHHARHDSVLATLLMLCHYRMCETGIAQFKTQFAGVKKLLGMRASGVQTGNWGWMESIFTFFDAITATVNDREAQLRGGYLDMIANPWTPSSALENLAGCDGKLFKTIACLGRLNLLAQHRPVLDPLRNTQTPPVTHPSSPPMHQQPHLAAAALTELYLHSPVFPSSQPEQCLPPIALPSPPAPNQHDTRHQFWAEWKATRQSLQTWNFSSSSLLSSLSPIVPSSAQIRDFGYVSEAFRHAALLYTERLAAPHLASSHLSFQCHVSQVLFYVTSLSGTDGENDAMSKFLLWPLFIAGSEAVNECHRDIVRDRTRGIARRGGYGNNLAGLDVLERIWEENDAGMGAGQGRGMTVFRWEKWMRGVDGEYIMV